MSVLLETTFGDLVIDLDVDGSPALSKNVLKLAKARYYTNTLIYNVVPGRYCQMGGELMLLLCRAKSFCNTYIRVLINPFDYILQRIIRRPER